MTIDITEDEYCALIITLSTFLECNPHSTNIRNIEDVFMKVAQHANEYDFVPTTIAHKQYERIKGDR